MNSVCVLDQLCAAVLPRNHDTRKGFGKRALGLLLASGQYTPMSVSHPEVFRYEKIRMEHGQRCTALFFYERAASMTKFHEIPSIS